MPKRHDIDGQIAALLGKVKRDINVSRKNRVFCNRNLKMATVEMIGFDMDYTLALYHQEKLETLSIELTLKKLIENLGYSKEILDLDYNRKLAIRGMVVDVSLGNVFKMDRHGFVGQVFHGVTPLTKEEKNKLYRSSRIRLGTSRYHWIDTLFGLPEAVMYMRLVDFLEAKTKKLNYKKLYSDIRQSIDMAHRDGSLKKIIRADLGTYVKKDPHLAETLHKLRSSGKTLFLLTNSYWLYSNDVMTYLLDGENDAYPSWRDYFDVVLVGGQKPGFFNDTKPFLEVDLESGEAKSVEVKKLAAEKVYQGGNIDDFQRFTGMSGEQVLYIGDHIYGDVIRLKKGHLWRTCLVLQELEYENNVSERQDQPIRDLVLLDRRRRNLESEIDYQVLMLKQIEKLMESGDPNLLPKLEHAKNKATEVYQSLKGRFKMIHAEVSALEGQIHRSYNEHWGPMFREGNENSRFGQQVSDYADLYTSRVSNFLYYSPLRFFRSPRVQMPHEV